MRVVLFENALKEEEYSVAMLIDGILRVCSKGCMSGKTITQVLQYVCILHHCIAFRLRGVFFCHNGKQTKVLN